MQVVQAVIEAQASSPSAGLGGPLQFSLTLPASDPRPSLPTQAAFSAKVSMPARNVTLSELQRLKRQFVNIHKKVITLGAEEKGAIAWDAEQVVAKFVTYLEENLNR